MQSKTVVDVISYVCLIVSGIWIFGSIFAQGDPRLQFFSEHSMYAYIPLGIFYILERKKTKNRKE